VAPPGLVSEKMEFRKFVDFKFILALGRIHFMIKCFKKHVIAKMNASLTGNADFLKPWWRHYRRFSANALSGVKMMH